MTRHSALPFFFIIALFSAVFSFAISDAYAGPLPSLPAFEGPSLPGTIGDDSGADIFTGDGPIPSGLDLGSVVESTGVTDIGGALGDITGGAVDLGGAADGFGPGEIIGRVLCGVADWIDGDVGQALATLAVITVGAGFLLGKINPASAGLVIIGIATIFGAPDLLDDFLNGDAGIGLFSFDVSLTVGGGCYDTVGGSAGLPTGDNAIADVLCEVVGWLLGPIGRAVSTLAILVLGIGAMFGKVSWPMALTTGVGISVLYGAPRITSELIARANLSLQMGCNDIVSF